MHQRMLKMDDRLTALTTSERALCDVVLGTNRGNTQLVSHLDEGRFQVDSLFEGVRCGTLATLTSVGSHYGGVNFDAIGRGYAPGKSKSDILAICSATGRCEKVLKRKMLAVSNHL